RQMSYQCACFRRGLLCLRQTIFWTRLGVSGKQNVGVGQSGVGKRVVRVFVDRLIKISNRFLKIRTGAFVPEISASQIKLMRFSGLGGASGEGVLLGSCQLGAKRVGDGPGNVALGRKNVD